MHVVRRGILILISPLFTLCLFLTALDWGVVQTVGSPNDTKKLIAESGVYNGIGQDIISHLEKADTSVGQLSGNDPLVQQAAQKSITPADVQANTEAAIDSIYQWLDGKTTQPQFKIELSQFQTAFANNLADAAKAKALSLPACTTPYTASSFDITNATCLPKGLSADTVASQIKKDINGTSVVDNPVITANNFKGTNNGQSAFETNWKNLPSRYQQAKKTPAVLIILDLLLAAAIVLLSLNHLRGLRRVGIALLMVGIVMLAIGWGLNRANTQLIQPKINLANDAILQQSFKNLVTDIIQKVDNNYWWFGGIYAVLGAIAMALPLFLNRGKPVAAGADDKPSKPEAQDKPAHTDKPEAASPKSSPVKKKTTKINVL